MKEVLIINGPNLNLLGNRQNDIYGKTSLSEIQDLCEKEASNENLQVSFFQSNSESEIIDEIQKSTSRDISAIIINAAAYTHTSVAIRDALLATELPIIEIHLSNVFKREEFRHKSFISDISQGVICGFGVDSYLLAIKAVKNILK